VHPRTPLALAVAFAVALGVAAAVPAAAHPSKNGRIAFFTDRDGNDEIYSMNPDGSDQVNLTANPADDFDPAYSPNGRLIAFTSDREDDGALAIFVMRADGSGQRRLITDTPPGFWDFDPTWSPDAHRLAFTRSTAPTEPDGPPGPGEIWTAKLGGRDLHNLTNTPEIDDFEADWSPRGSRIAFTSDGGAAAGENIDVWDMRARDGGDLRRLTDAPGFDGGPDYSPDGRRIAFDSERTGNGDVYVMRANGANPIRLTESDGNDILTAFSPDGTMIAFSTNRDAPPPLTPESPYEIYAMNADGTDERNLTNSLESNDEWPTWQPLFDHHW
jgi:Tol biopolymer transport system component